MDNAENENKNSKFVKKDDCWLELSGQALPLEEVNKWVGRPDCGAVVTFLGNARDHSSGRENIIGLEYEAYGEFVLPRLQKLADEAVKRWGLGRIALLHRVGSLNIGDTAVIVSVSSAHRQEAFEAAKFCIDSLKHSVPIWKKETSKDGSNWGLESQHITDLPGDAP